MPGGNTAQWYFKFFKKAEKSYRCNGETLLTPCARKKKLQRAEEKLTKDYYRIAAAEILIYSVIFEMIIIPLFTCRCLKDKTGAVQ